MNCLRADQNDEIENAIDLIVQDNFSGMHRKVEASE